MARKIIKFEVQQVPNDCWSQCNYISWCLCDDGTMWELRDNECAWRQLPVPGGAPDIAAAMYETLQSIVDQLEFCEYQTKDGLHDLKVNAAFIALKQRAAAENCGSKTGTVTACPWANDSECENVNIKCHDCVRDPLLQHRKDYAVIA